MRHDRSLGDPQRAGHEGREHADGRPVGGLLQGTGRDQGRNIRGVAVREDARNEIGKAVQHVLAMNRFVGWQAAVSDQTLQPGLPGADEPGMSRPHRMPVTADPVRFHLRPTHQEIDCPLHIEDILPGHALSVDDIPQEFEPFERTIFQFSGRVPAFFKTQGVWTEHHIPFARQRRPGVMHRVRHQSGGFRLSLGPVPRVLMPDADRWCRLAGIHAIRD